MSEAFFFFFWLLEKKQWEADFTVSFQHSTGNPASNNEKRKIKQRAWNLILASTMVNTREWMPLGKELSLFRFSC